MTSVFIYYLERTIFASQHLYTEVATRDWTLAGWCCVLSSQCTRIHLMIHQCHPDLFPKCLRKMHSSIILQRYGTNVILKTSLDDNTVRWWSSYHHDYGTRLHFSLPTICSSIAHLYWCHKQWSLSTVIVPVYIYFNIPGCYYFSSTFAHRLEVHRSTKSSAVGQICYAPRMHCTASNAGSDVDLVALHCEQCSSFVNDSPAYSVCCSSTTRQPSTIPDASIHWSWSNTTPSLHTFLIYVHRFAVWPFAHCAVQWLRLRLHCTVAMLADYLQRLRETFWHLFDCIVVF